MLLDEVAQLIIDNTTKAAGTDLFKSFNHPRSQDSATFLIENQGVAPQRVFASSTPAWENAFVQIIDRSSDYQTARNSAEETFKLLQGQANVTLKPSTGATGVTYLNIEPQQSPFSIGTDDNDRFQISCNYLVMKSLST